MSGSMVTHPLWTVRCLSWWFGRVTSNGTPTSVRVWEVGEVGEVDLVFSVNETRLNGNDVVGQFEAFMGESVTFDFLHNQRLDGVWEEFRLTETRQRINNHRVGAGEEREDVSWRGGECDGIHLEREGRLAAVL